jgi:twitching motility protein PilT
VFATLHTNDAVQAIDRIIDVFPSAQQSQVRSQLSSALNGVVSQRLLPKRGGGRVAAYEVMIGTPAIKNLIRDNKMHQALGIMEASQREGCQTLDQHVQQLFTEGLIAADEASRYMRNGRVQTATTPRY